jgi:hypothetical protein
MSDIDIFQDDVVVIIIAIAMIIIFVAAMLVCLLIAFRSARQIDGGVTRTRFFGYFIGASSSALAGLLFILVANYCWACVRWSIDYVGVWVGGLIVIWPVAAYIWNRRLKRPVLR